MSSYGKLFKKAKIAEYDVYRLKVTINEVQLRGFDVEIVREPVEALGFGTRVLSREGELVGIGLSSCSQESELEKCIGNARLFSTLNKQKGKYEFPQSKPDSRVATVDKAIRDNAVETINEYTKSLIDHLRGEGQSSKSIKPTFGKIRTYLFETDIENSAGLAKKKVETYFYLELALKVSDGVKFAEFWPRKYRRRIDDLKVDQVLPRWVELARDALDATVAPAGQMPVIMNPASLCDAIVPTVGFHAAGEQKLKNQTVFSKGNVVASKELSITDDGLLDYGLMSAPFDDEGNPQKRTSIINNGVFENFIYDQKHALMLNEKSTGNGIKTAASANPVNKHTFAVANHPTNISIKPGNINFDDLVREIKEGILIEQFSWLNPEQFSSGFSTEIRNAYLIKNGEIKQPLKGGMVAGKVFDLMKNISGISNSAEIESGATAFTIVAPYIRFENVTVAGK
nr:TldD/PmbA family protein [Candidatus Njordarchaeum guaymaensis]